MTVLFPESPLDLITGDLTTGRPSFGPLVRLEVYRVLLYSVKNTLEAQLGQEKADELLYQAGNEAGKTFYNQVIGDMSDIDEFILSVKRVFKNLRVANIEFDSVDLQRGRILLTATEDIDCSGLPNQHKEVCVFSEGLISGLLEAFTGDRFEVREVACWASGGRACKFVCQRPE